MSSIGQLTLDSSYEDVAEALIGEMKRRNYSRDEAIGATSTLIQESNLNPRARNPAGPWDGIAQQDASYPGRFDANTQITGFLDRLDTKRLSPGHGDIWLNCFWLQQRPSESTAAQAYANGRKAYLTEIKSRTAEASRLVGEYWDVAPGEGASAVPDNRPDFNEYPVWSQNSQDRGGTTVDLFLLHTQEGGGGNDAADNLAQWLRGDVGVSYHYTIGQADDGGVTVCDVVDTDLASWSVLSANNRSINLCFAGSRASWTRGQWLDNAGRAIMVAAYLAVLDCKKYGINPRVIKPPYNFDPPGISDHRYVTKRLGDGTHTDVGDGFPWDIFEAAVVQFSAPSQEPQQPPADPPVPPKSGNPRSDRVLLEEIWDQERGPEGNGWDLLDGRTKVEALRDILSELGELRAAVAELKAASKKVAT